ncbi:DnaJ homolog subfamily C GRV2-like protein [Drosera capensis]
MDFVSRHTNNTSTSSDSSSAPSSSSSPSTANHVVEEPEYLARYMVVKHSWRGRYKRILCLSDTAIVTLDPGTLNVTNSYNVGSDFEGAGPVLGRDESSNEFNLIVRTDSKGKFKPIKYSSRYRASILTELHQIRGMRVGSVAEFPVLHLRRRNSEWVPYFLIGDLVYEETKLALHSMILLKKRESVSVLEALSSFRNEEKMRITSIGVELMGLRPGDLRWCLDFRDMNSPAVIILTDTSGRRNSESGGFILCPLYGRKSKAFQAASGTSNTAIISHLTKTAKTMVGVSLSVNSSTPMTVPEYIKQRAKEAVGADETPCGGWSVTRLRTAARGTVNLPGLSLGVGPKGGLGEHGDAVSRQLILTNVSLVERRPENYEAVIVRPLSTVSTLVRFAEEPQMFAIEFNDGCPVQLSDKNLDSRSMQAHLVIAYLLLFVMYCRLSVNVLYLYCRG